MYELVERHLEDDVLLVEGSLERGGLRRPVAREQLLQTDARRC